LFSDEEDGYNIEETRYKLKVDAPANDAGAEPVQSTPDMGGGEMNGLDDVLDDAPDNSNDEKPFEDEPFDAGVEADEDTDPAKFIQQLAGKLGQSLRQYTDNQGQPDFDLEKFAVNSVLSATHTSEMDQSDQKDIINKVKGAGKDDNESNDDENNLDTDNDEPTDDTSGDDSLDFGEEPVEEIVEELPLNSGEMSIDVLSPEMSGMITGCQMEPPIDDEAASKLKSIADLQESKINGIFVDKTKLITNLRLMENVEPMVEPKPIVKPAEKPAEKPDVQPLRPMRETERPFLPKRKDGVQPDPKGKAIDEIIPFKGKEVNSKTLEIDGVNKMDYPDFADSFFSSGYFTDGSELSPDDLETFNKENTKLKKELIFNKELYK
jgi:hypothetical protein